jgi:hypothetical protein
VGAGVVFLGLLGEYLGAASEAGEEALDVALHVGAAREEELAEGGLHPIGQGGAERGRRLARRVVC